MNHVHFAIPEIYGETLSYYELLRKLVDKVNELIENYNTVPDQINEAVENLDASQLFSTVLNQLIHSIATDNTKSANAVKVYKKHDLLYATFNDTVNLYESLIDFKTGTETELIVGTNIREVNISELFIELRKLIDINKNNIEAVTAVANENSAEITTLHNDITGIENKNTEQDTEISTLRTMISSPYNFKGDVVSISALPASGEVNDTYYVQDVKYKVTWTGSAWVQSSLSEADYETELSELKSDLNYVYDGYHKLSFATVENEYPTPSGTFLPYNNYRRSDYIPLNGADALYINNTSIANDNVWYDADKNPISAFSIPLGEPAVLYPPSNAEYAIISNWATAFYSAVYVDVKNTKADTLSKLRSLKSLNYDIVDGEYYREGTLYTSTEYQHYRHTSYIDVSDFDKVVVTAEGEYTNDMYLFFDEEKTFLSSVRTDTTITLQEVPIPSNAKYIIVCSNDKSVEPFVGAYLPIVNDVLVEKTSLKSWLLIGDSLTDETNDTATKRYFEWLKEPSCTTTNIAVSGSGYLRNNGGTTNNFVSKVDGLTGNEGYDIISVFGGINDSGNFDEYPLGNFGDTTPTTYYGAIYYVFNALITKFPTAFIFAITPTVPDYRHGANNGCDQLADAIKEVCRWLKVPVADVNATCGLRPWIVGNQSKYYYDGVHPNAEGHKLIANCVRGVFQYMID